MIRAVFMYIRWRRNWDALCERCGLCCYTCTNDNGEVAVDLSSPCQFLDEHTHLCSVYESRFDKFPGCGKLTLYQALFNPRIPPGCIYVRLFRFWSAWQMGI